MQEHIIQFLKQAPDYISGEEISRRLKISRAGIWKHIQELRKEGYDILAVPHLGYRLNAIPDKLFPHEIQFNLNTQYLGHKVLHYESLHSTMDQAFQLGMEGEEEGTVICAETQTKGRGRQGRSWVSPKGKGIYMSLLLRPKSSPSDATQLTLLSAVAVCEAVGAVSGLESKIKWPNDILINNLKLAGILTELSAEMDRVRFVVIGVGINVNTPLSLLPKNSTSLKYLAKRSLSRVELIQEILRRTETWYDCLKSEGFAPVVQRWKELSTTLGRRIRVTDVNGRIEGKAVDLDEYGGLIIHSDSGETIKKMSGDVVEVK